LEEGFRKGTEAAAKLIECGCKDLLHGKGECQFPGNCSLEDAAAIRALSSEPVADGWLPIETAPKDGTDIQVTGHKYGPRVLTASYGNSGPYDRSKKTYKAGWSYSPGSLIDPTHWRPLPASPGASE